MLSLSPATRVFVAMRTAYLCLGFDCVSDGVKNHLREYLVSGYFFLFDSRPDSRTVGIGKGQR